MKTNIILVRHVETIGNIEKRLTGKKDYALTKKGQITIDKLTEYLKNTKIDSIYSSTSKRAIETISKIANIKGIKINKLDDLCEMYFGIYDGFKWEEVKQINPLIHKKHIETNEIMCIPEQETTEQVSKRMYMAIKKIAEENEGKTVLIASHGVAIEAFIRMVTEEPFNIKIKQYSQNNGAVNRLLYDFDKKKFEIEVINDTSYLQGGEL